MATSLIKTRRTLPLKKLWKSNLKNFLMFKYTLLDPRKRYPFKIIECLSLSVYVSKRSRNMSLIIELCMEDALSFSTLWTLQALKILQSLIWISVWEWMTGSKVSLLLNSSRWLKEN